jgi:hypothetical protein
MCKSEGHDLSSAGMGRFRYKFVQKPKIIWVTLILSFEMAYVSEFLWDAVEAPQKNDSIL